MFSERLPTALRLQAQLEGCTVPRGRTNYHTSPSPHLKWKETHKDVRAALNPQILRADVDAFRNESARKLEAPNS